MTGGHFWAMTTAPDAHAARRAYAAHTHTQIVDQMRGDRDRLTVFNDVDRRGQAWNFLRALTAGLDAGAERITLLEDDLEICRGFVDRVNAHPIPDDVAFISWFDPFLGCPRLGDYYHVTVPSKEPMPLTPQLVRRVCSLFYCNQALTFSRATAEKIRYSPLAMAWNRPHEGDVLIAQVLQLADYGVHFPSLVQHVGAVSLCNPGQPLKKNRISHHYPGRDFDAGTLEIFG